jgi:aryl-alcohol dehydrogenase-like predicted oxidoreductase
MHNKLVLGTANFGMRYGVSNNMKLSADTSTGLLEFAESKGLWGVDTASAYGDAESVVGRFFAHGKRRLHIITKLPNKEYPTPSDVDNEIRLSLQRMQVPRVDVLLIHSYETFKKHRSSLLHALDASVEDGLVGRFGLSVYRPEEAEDFLRAAASDNIAIEFPLNLFDRRFLRHKVMEKLNGDGHLSIARSVFLQGLFFLDETRLKATFPKESKKFDALGSLRGPLGPSVELAAFLFVVTNPCVDKVIIGVDTVDQLMRNLELLSRPSVDRYDSIRDSLDTLRVDDESIVLPFLWPELLTRSGETSSGRAR